MGYDQIGKILEGQGRKEGESKDPFITFSFTLSFTPTHLGIGKSEEVRALERNLTEEIILGRTFCVEAYGRGSSPRKFPQTSSADG